MHHFQYSITTKANPSLAWEIYTNLQNWPAFANIYGELKWDGRPWEVGSRLEIEIVRPVKTVIDHLIICCEPTLELGWIDRAADVTIGQWVKFEPQPDGGTRVHTWGDVSPSGKMIVGRSVEHLVRVFTATWYENFRMACDGLPIKSDPTVAIF